MEDEDLPSVVLDQTELVALHLEDFRTAAVTRLGIDPERDIRPWLRPASDRAWQRWNEQWGEVRGP